MKMKLISGIIALLILSSAGLGMVSAKSEYGPVTSEVVGNDFKDSKFLLKVQERTWTDRDGETSPEWVLTLVDKKTGNQARGLNFLQLPIDYHIYDINGNEIINGYPTRVFSFGAIYCPGDDVEHTGDQDLIDSLNVSHFVFGNGIWNSAYVGPKPDDLTLPDDERVQLSYRSEFLKSKYGDLPS
jgi:hypothetical protein